MPNILKQVVTSTLNGLCETDITADNDGRHLQLGEERVRGRRTEILLNLQRELEELMDRHDDLVREAFQLDKFVTLLKYDPKVAKQDTSQVFLQYREPFDLITKSVEADGGARKTRRALTEQRMSVSLALNNSTGGVPDMPSSPTHKGHSFDSIIQSPLIDRNELEVELTGKPKPKRKGGTINFEQSVESTPVVPKRIMHARKAKTTPTSFAQASPLLRGVKRKASSLFQDSDRIQDAVVDTTSSACATETRLLDVKPSIKRVRLFQRPRPMSYTHPSQVPLKPRYDNSVRKLLGSYLATEDGDHMIISNLEDSSTKEAKLRARIRALRKEGRLTLNVLDLPENFMKSSIHKSQVELRHEDHHQGLISSALHRSQTMLTESSFKHLVSKRISKGVLAWHASREGNEERIRKTEVSRLKTLAKLTAKEVERQWKKAVFAIRERNRAILDAEEARLGRMHLDAILDQSGMILEAQQLDLTRIRSRSGSIKDWSTNDDSEIEGLGSDDTKRENDMDTDTDSEFPDVDASYLLGPGAAQISGADTEHGSHEAESKSPSADALSGSRNSSRFPDEPDEPDEPYYQTPPDEVVSVSTEDADDDDASVAFTTTNLDEGTHGNKETDTDEANVRTVSLSVHSENDENDLDHQSFTEILETAGGNGLPENTGTREPITSLAPEMIVKTQDLSSFEVLSNDLTENVQDENALNLPEAVVDSNLELPTQEDRDHKELEIEDEDIEIPPHLRDFAVAPVNWVSESKISPPFLLRGVLRPYQLAGLEWLASLHTNQLNGILADEMGLGKTIQTISLLAHLACDRGIWGPHLIIVPTSVLLNWEMEFKKFLPGFKILSYHGNTKRRKELRVGWNNKHAFNVCVTSYTLASRDAHIFKRKSWYYMILDEAHMIKNFKSQRWNILLMFRSFRRLLLTGTPLQNNLIELWALLQFLMSGTDFANVKEFGDWFSNPLEKAIEQGTVMDEETQERVRKLHTVLRPYLMRRLKSDVEKELPSKYEHIVTCRLSKRQRFLYDEFMSRAATRESLASGLYHRIANVLMQLRKVCNHPDLFEVRPIVTSFAMPRSATANFEVKEFLIRRRWLQNQDEQVNLELLGLAFLQHQGKSMMQARSTRSLDASRLLVSELPGEPPPPDTRNIEGYKQHIAYQRRLAAFRQWTHIAYVNNLRCIASPVYGLETITAVRRLSTPLTYTGKTPAITYLEQSDIIPKLVKSFEQQARELIPIIGHFAFVTPAVVAKDMAAIALSDYESQIFELQRSNPSIMEILHPTSVKLQIAFPDASLVQYDCGKLQELAILLREKAAGRHRVLIFTQMTKVLDILEIFLNFHGYRYLRLDGATKIEDRQYITERFNNDPRIFAFIASSRSGGVGINLTGADTVIFYDSDFNPQMDRQCEDRAHRIGQIRDVHIYRFISEHTVEESMLRKANQKRSLDNIVIQQGEFDWHSLLLVDDVAFGQALEEFEDQEDALAARLAAREEAAREVEDHADFAAENDVEDVAIAEINPVQDESKEEEEEAGKDGTIAEYMLSFVNYDWEWFVTW